MEKLLTIAIPTYNRSAYLDRALEHIERQYDERLEILVSDNASTDNTPQIVQKYEKSLQITYLKNDINKGADVNFLNCFKGANGKFIILLGDDDVFVEGAINYILDYLEKNLESSLVFMNFASFYDNYDSIEDCKKPWLIDTGDMSNVSKSIFIGSVGRQISFMSCLILCRKKILEVPQPERFIGSYFIHSYIALESVADKCANLGIITHLCIAKHNPSNQEDIALNHCFEIFGLHMHDLLCKKAVECGFDKKQLKKIYKQFACKTFVSKILTFKSWNDKSWKNDFWQFCYPVIKKYPDMWIKIMPVLLVPRFCARFLVKKVKPIIKRLKNK